MDEKGARSLQVGGRVDVRKNSWVVSGDRKGVVARNDGDADAGLAGAAKVIEATYTFPYLAHAPLAGIYDGGSRSDAARIGGVGLQIVRDWVVRFNAEGLPAFALGEVGKIETVLTLLPDSPAAYEEWKRLVATYAVSGAKVHDARLVALMNGHGVRRSLLSRSESPCIPGAIHT